MEDQAKKHLFFVTSEVDNHIGSDLPHPILHALHQGQQRPNTPYLAIFLSHIACQYVVFELPAHYGEWVQAMLAGYFETLETG